MLGKISIKMAIIMMILEGFGIFYQKKCALSYFFRMQIIGFKEKLYHGH